MPERLMAHIGERECQHSQCSKRGSIVDRGRLHGYE